MLDAITRYKRFVKSFQVFLYEQEGDNSRFKAELRAREKITSHFGISSSDHFWQILKTKNLVIPPRAG